MDLPTNQLYGALIVAIIAAVLTTGLKWHYDKRLAQRKDRLDRINRQLELLYGPLLALSHASSEAWKGFRSMYRPQGAFFDSHSPNTQAELDAWILWMREVFMPLNQRIENILLDHLDLLDETKLPACLLDLFSHVEGYKGVMKEWDNKNYSRYTSTNDFPIGIETYAREHYTKLKKAQAELLQT